MVLKVVDKNAQPSKMEGLLTHAPFWVRIYDLPFGKRKAKHIKSIANSIGVFVKADEICYLSWTKSLEVKILMDLHKPSPDEIVVEIEDGKDVCLSVKYEKLHNLCYFYGQVAHVEHDCWDKEEDDGESTVYSYGEWK